MAIRARRPAIAHRASHPPSTSRRAYRAATGPTAKAVYVAIGMAGLAGLAIAIFGPRRFQRVVIQPVQSAVSDQAERLWSEARPLRTQLGGLIERAGSEAGREKLVRSFQSWIGHFRAT
jgi:hypothetical protein